MSFTRVNYSDIGLSKSVSPATAVDYLDTVTYTLTLSNSGDLDASGVIVTDTLPADLSFGGWISQPSGASESNGLISWTGTVFTASQRVFVYTATYTAKNYGDTLTNTAEFFHSSAQGIDAGYRSASLNIVDAPDLHLSKSGPASRNPGQAITYTLSLSNAGPATAHAITLTDVLPPEITSVSVDSTLAITAVDGLSYTWTLADLAANASGVITLMGYLDSPLATGIFTNTASLTTAYPEADADNNQASFATTINNVAPVLNAVSFSGSEDSIFQQYVPASDDNGDTLTYTVVSTVSLGSLNFDASGTFFYTPTNRTESYTDSFSVQVTDGALNSDIITVTLSVTAANDALNVSEILTSTTEDAPLSLALSASVTDADSNDSFSISDVSDASDAEANAGQLAIASGQTSLVYTPLNRIASTPTPSSSPWKIAARTLPPLR